MGTSTTKGPSPAADRTIWSADLERVWFPQRCSAPRSRPHPTPLGSQNCDISVQHSFHPQAFPSLSPVARQPFPGSVFLSKAPSLPVPIFLYVAHSSPLFLHKMMCACGKNHIQVPGSLNFIVFILAGVLGLFLWMDMMKINLSLTTTSKISQAMPREVSSGT